MIFYILLSVSFLLFHFFLRTFVKNDYKANVIETFLLGAVLLFLSSLRSIETGSDSEAYFDLFRRIPSLSYNELMGSEMYMEKGFLILCKIMSYISTSYHWLFFWSSAISIIPVAFLINKYCKYPFIGWVCYILFHQFSFEMNIMRQSIAMGLCLIAFMITTFKKDFRENIFSNHPLSKKRTILKYVFAFFIIGIAFTIHKSSIGFLAILILPLIIKRMDAKKYFIVILVSILVFIFFDRVSLLLKNYGLLSDTYLSAQQEGTGLTRILIPIIMLFSFLFFRYCVKTNRFFNQNKSLSLKMELCLLLDVALSLSSLFVISLSRASLYLRIFYIIAIPEMIYSHKHKTDRFLFGLGCFSVLVIYFIICYETNNHFDYIFWK